MKRGLSFLFIVLITCVYYGNTQGTSSSIISPAGGVSKNDIYSIEWTIGETVTSTCISNKDIFTQGFNQSFLYTGMASKKNESFFCKVAAIPNPVFSSVNVFIESVKPGTYSLMITDITGLNVFQNYRNLKAGNLSIDMRPLANGVYFLRVYDSGNRLINTTKLVKL